MALHFEDLVSEWLSHKDDLEQKARRVRTKTKSTGEDGQTRGLASGFLFGPCSQLWRCMLSISLTARTLGGLVHHPNSGEEDKCEITPRKFFKAW